MKNIVLSAMTISLLVAACSKAPDTETPKVANGTSATGATQTPAQTPATSQAGQASEFTMN